MGEEDASPNLDDSEEMEQVQKFLAKEHEAFQRPGVYSSEEAEPSFFNESSRLCTDLGVDEVSQLLCVHTTCT